MARKQKQKRGPGGLPRGKARGSATGKRLGIYLPLTAYEVAVARAALAGESVTTWARNVLLGALQSESGNARGDSGSPESGPKSGHGHGPGETPESGQ